MDLLMDSDSDESIFSHPASEIGDGDSSTHSAENDALDSFLEDVLTRSPKSLPRLVEQMAPLSDYLYGKNKAQRIVRTLLYKFAFGHASDVDAETARAFQDLLVGEVGSRHLPAVFGTASPGGPGSGDPRTGATDPGLPPWLAGMRPGDGTSVPRPPLFGSTSAEYLAGSAPAGLLPLLTAGALGIGSKFSLSDLQASHSPAESGPRCGHVFRTNESVYRCKQCAMDSTCVLCASCYRSSLHYAERHDVTVSMHGTNSGGCCDCGDPEAYKPGTPSGCAHHGPAQPKRGPQGPAAARLERYIDDQLASLLEWALSVLEAMPKQRTPPKTEEEVLRAGRVGGSGVATPSGPASGVATPSGPASGVAAASGPPAATGTSTSSIPGADTASLPAPSYLSATAPPPAPSAQVSPHPSGTSVDPTPPPTLHSIPASARLSPAPAASPVERAAGPWAVVLWNDETHTFQQVIDQIVEATGLPRNQARKISDHVDTRGREVVYISPDPHKILVVARKINSIELSVSVHNAYHFFYESIAADIVSFALDLARSHVGGVPRYLAETVARVFLQAPRIPTVSHSIFQRFLKLDPLLWKDLRIQLSDLYVVFMGCAAEVRNTVALQYSIEYSHIALTYALAEREPDYSVSNFSVQIFTAPSLNDYVLHRVPLVNQLIGMLYSLVTDQFRTLTSLENAPPPNYKHRKINLSSTVFRKRKYAGLFLDLTHLFNTSSVQRYVCANAKILDHFLYFLCIFTGMAPNKRAVDTHVEYENDLWVIGFNVTLPLSRLTFDIGRAFRKEGTPAQLIAALRAVYEYLTGQDTYRLQLYTQDIDIPLHILEVAGETYKLSDYRIERDPASFHHPMSWLFGELAKQAHLLTPHVLADAGYTDLASIFKGIGAEKHLLFALDQPLRAIALAAQIRAGLWVRNGMAMRAQQVHYKEYNLCEKTYDMDVHYVRFALVAFDPGMVLASILDRFSLSFWMLGIEREGEFDVSQTLHLAEDFLFLLIVIFSDRRYMSNLPESDVLEDELIHILCLKSASYSELVKQIPEYLEDSPEFGEVLSRIADFKEPVGVNDQGIYSLKSTYYEKVNPYFSRFNRNNQERAEKRVQEHMRKTRNVENYVIIPQKLALTEGAFAGLTAVLNHKVLIYIVLSMLARGQGDGGAQSEALLDAALQLCMLIFVNSPEEFSRVHVVASMDYCSSHPGDDIAYDVNYSSILEQLVKIEDDPAFKGIRHKATWLLDSVHGLNASAVDAVRSVKGPAAVEDTESKKKAAQARQAAIMKQFAQAQQTFLANTDNFGDDSDELMDEDAPETAEEENFGACIFCQEELDHTQNFGSLAFIQASNFIRHLPSEEQGLSYSQDVLEMPLSLDADLSNIRPFGYAARKVASSVVSLTRPTSPSPDDATASVEDGLGRAYARGSNRSGLYIDSCGHLMHADCFDEYCRVSEQQQRSHPLRSFPDDSDRLQYLCPLCKSLSNVFLPYSVKEAIHIPEYESGELGAWVSNVDNPVVQSFEASRNSVEASAQLAQKLETHITRGGTGLRSWIVSGSLHKSVYASNRQVGRSRIIQVCHPLVKELQFPDRAAYFPRDLVAYTVSVLEVARRGQDIRMTESLSETSLRTLNSLLAILRSLALMQTPSWQSVNLNVFVALDHIGGQFAINKENSDFFFLEPLTALVQVATVIPKAFDQLAAFCFYTQLIQNMFYLERFVALSHTSKTRGPSSASLAGVSSEESAAFALIKDWFVASGSEANLHPVFHAENATVLGKMLYSTMLVFMRRVALLRQTLAPRSPTPGPTSGLSEMQRLLEAVGIPSPADVLDMTKEPPNAAVHVIRQHIIACRRSIPGYESYYAMTRSLPSRIIQPPVQMEVPVLPGVVPDSPIADMVHLLSNSKYNSLLEYTCPYELVWLPNQLDTLSDYTLKTPCKNCGKIPGEPAICLICGDIVCAQSYCCMDTEPSGEYRHGECNTHMWKCGAHVAIYFLVKKNSLLYLFTRKGTFATAPYLDIHGEVVSRRYTSTFMQYLHRPRFDEVRKLWMTHAIPTYIARISETSDLGGWEMM